MLIAALVLAFLIESSVEHFFAKPLKQAMKYRTAAKWTPYVALALGIAAAIGFDVDLFKDINVKAVSQLVGQIATGFIIGRGGQFVSDFAGRFKGQA